MNRYSPTFSMPALAWVLAFAALLFSALADAGVRTFPKTAERGNLRVVQGFMVELNGTQEQMAPGVLIKSTNNTSVVPASLAGRTHVINFTRNGQGQVNKVWLLNLMEAQQPAPNEADKPSFFGSLFKGSEPAKDDGNTPYDQLPKYGEQ